MDPQATWNALMQAWTVREWPEVVENAQALLDWLGRDGFPPKTTPVADMGADWNRNVARSAARFALRRAASVLDDANGIPTDVAFTLSCADCNNEGPTTFEVATQQGWTGIRYMPASMSENFLGRCSECSRRD